MYYDGRTDARSVRTNMQFLLGEKTLRRSARRSSRRSATFRPFCRASSRPSIRSRSTPSKAERGQVVFEANCARCHGTYGPDGELSQQDRPARRDRHRPGAVAGPLGPAGRPLQRDLVRGRASRSRPSESATRPRRSTASGRPAPYLHNGSVPTLHALLDSSSRPVAVHPAALDRFRALRHSGTSAGSSTR